MFFIIYYRPQQSWGKVIFSEVCVKNSVHRGRGACMAGGHVWWGVCVAGCVCGGVGWECAWQGHAWWEVCVAGGMHGRGHA